MMSHITTQTLPQLKIFAAYLTLHFVDKHQKYPMIYDTFEH